MMPTEHTHAHVTYEFSELSEDAQRVAIERVAENMAGPWWDSFDTDAVGGEILYTLAEAIGAPGWDQYGPGDFPGIPNLTIEAWDVDRGGVLDIRGTLTPETAPKLTWGPAEEALLSRDHYSRTVALSSQDEDGYWSDVEDQDAVWAWDRSWEDARGKALAAGRAAIEWHASEERAREWCEDAGPAFNEDGTLHND